MESFQVLTDYKINLLNVYPETIADGEGIRYSIYLAGCIHACPGCHNEASWSPTAGTRLTDDIFDSIIEAINKNPLLDGITLSGGDPFFHPEALLEILQRLKTQTGLNIWCYTGYTYEQLLEDTRRVQCLDYIDTLVDGLFEIDKFDPTILFRGSTNQRLIYLKKESREIIKIK